MCGLQPLHVEKFSLLSFSALGGFRELATVFQRPNVEDERKIKAHFLFIINRERGAE